MKKLLFIVLLLPSICLAEGPLFQFHDSSIQQEFENVYQSLRRPVYFSSGSVSSPSIAFLGGDDGFYLVGPSQIGVAIDGVNYFQFSNMNFQMLNGVVLRATNGTLSGPSYTFDNDITTGRFLSATGNMRDVVSGSTVAVYASTGVAIKGMTSGLTTIPGNYGEVISSATANATNFPSTGNRGDLVAVLLTPGHWIVLANLYAALNGATMTSTEMGISDTSGNNTTNTVFGVSRVDFAPATSNYGSPAFLKREYLLNSLTTIYLKYQANFSAGTPQARGEILAIRVN